LRTDRHPFWAKVRPLLGSGGLTESTDSQQRKGMPQCRL